MKYSRIWEDEGGTSHVEWLPPRFEDIENYAEGVPTVGITARLPAGVTHLVKFPVGWIGDWHPTPAHQFWALLEGRLGAEVSDGESVEAGPGDCGLLEDLTGIGHKSWVVGEQAAIVLMVTLES